MVLFQTKIKFLGHEISNEEIIPINRSIDFADKFPDQFIDKTQLQRFLGSVNYIDRGCTVSPISKIEHFFDIKKHSLHNI